MPIWVDFFKDLVEKYGIFNVDKFLEDEQCSKSIQNSLIDFFILGNNEWKVLKQKTFQHIFSFLLLRTFDELRDDLACRAKYNGIVAGNCQKDILDDVLLLE